MNRNGIYPLTAFASGTNLPSSHPRALSPEVAESVKSETPEPVDNETRKVLNMTCQVRKIDESDIMMVNTRLLGKKKLIISFSGQFFHKLMRQGGFIFY